MYEAPITLSATSNSPLLRLYNTLLLPPLVAAMRLVSLFNVKVRRGFAGREKVVEEARLHYRDLPDVFRLLIHVSSFGELEQAKPVIARLREQLPDCHIHLTFFSPSGYENAVKTYRGVDFISYAPYDTPNSVRSFLDVVRPDLALFTRYDVWPNMAAELLRTSVPSILFCATGGLSSNRFLPLARQFHRTVYRSLSLILTISENDRLSFIDLGLAPDRVLVAGDTRFDQVVARKSLAVLAAELLPSALLSRVHERKTLVFLAASTWQSDESLLKKLMSDILERNDNILLFVAPHEVNAKRIADLIAAYPGNAIRLSAIASYRREPVIIVDSVGHLFELYRHADIAYVGGGFGAGVHNTLEPAVWSLPIMVGPRHQRSQEIAELISAGGCLEINTLPELQFAFWQLANDSELRLSCGAKALEFVSTHSGAAAMISDEIQKLLKHFA